MIFLENEKIYYDEGPLTSSDAFLQGLLSHSLSLSRGSLPQTNSKKPFSYQTKISYQSQLCKFVWDWAFGETAASNQQMSWCLCKFSRLYPWALRIYVELAQFSPNLGVLLHASLIPWQLCQMRISDCKCRYIHWSNSCFNMCLIYTSPSPFFNSLPSFTQPQFSGEKQVISSWSNNLWRQWEEFFPLPNKNQTNNSLPSCFYSQCQPYLHLQCKPITDS